MHIPVFKPLIQQEEIAAATQSLEHGWLGMGESVGEFESAILDYIGASDRHVVAVSTGHAALHLSMLLIGLKPGDEVITPSFNNIADFQAILATGAKPVLCDIYEDTLCIDVEKAEKLITSKTKAIIAMDYDCCMADHNALEDLAKKYELRIIHDAAHSFGSTYNGKNIGSFSDICMFSFDPVKTITCIDGGALVVKTPEEVEKLHEMRLLGMGQPASIMYKNQRAWTYDVARVGFRYHLANLHAAIGLEQIRKMPDISATRQSVCIKYSQSLSEIPEIILPKTDFIGVTPFLYYIRVPEGKREEMRDFLRDRGIDTGIHWQPAHWFTLFKGCKKGDLSVTEKIGNEIVSLPLHSFMDPEDQDIILQAIKEYFNA